MTSKFCYSYKFKAWNKVIIVIFNLPHAEGPIQEILHMQNVTLGPAIIPDD